MMKSLKLKRTVAIITITLTLIALVMAMTSLAFNNGPPEGSPSFVYGNVYGSNYNWYVSLIAGWLAETLFGPKGVWTILFA